MQWIRICDMLHTWKGNWRILIAQNVCTLGIAWSEYCPNHVSLYVSVYCLLCVCVCVNQLDMWLRLRNSAYWGKKIYRQCETNQFWLSHARTHPMAIWTENSVNIFCCWCLTLNKLATVPISSVQLSTLQFIFILVIDFFLHFAKTVNERISFCLKGWYDCVFFYPN